MRNKPEVSIIIVNWNGEGLLRECLESLCRQVYDHFEIIVVDNASTDNSVELVRDEYPHVRLIRLPQNQGFAGGNIEGFRMAKGEYIALFNNDAVAAPNWLQELVIAMNEDERVGICASKLLMQHQPDRIDSAGDGCVTSGHGFKRGNWETSPSYAERRYVFGACAAAALYRRKMIDDVGFFDEDFFINCEDTDLNFRAQLMGWKCVYVPRAVVLHKVSATVSGLSDHGLYYSSRNDECVWIKNMPTALMIRYFHHKVIQELGTISYFCVKKGKWGPVLRGKRDAILMLPQLLRKRKKLQGRKRVTNRYLNSVLTPIFNSNLLKGKIKRLFSRN
jgi:GT2 family glycosyltransferase